MTPGTYEIDTNTKYAIALVLVLVLMTGAYFIGVKTGQLPEAIYQAPDNDLNLVQWRKDWTQAGDSVVTASVVSNSGEQLYVYVDYIYSGRQGDEATACGNILRKGKNSHWSCSPVGVARGRGFITLRFGLISSAREIECSDEIQMIFYNKNAHTFFEKSFPFQKVWVKNGQGLYGKIREIFSTCPLTE